MTTTTPASALDLREDVGNLMLMEHVNVQVPDQSIATLFYFVGLGFTRDPHMMVGLENMWANLGEQQIHMPTGPAQVLRGTIGLVTPSLPALAQRLTSIAPRLEGTKFAWHETDGAIDVTCPWGNSFHVEGPSNRWTIERGIPYVRFDVPAGAAEGIASFYENVIGAPATLESDANGRRAIVSVGVYQQLIFEERESVPAYDGHHIAVYVTNFTAPLAALNEQGLVTEQPANHQFRFKDIFHPETKEHVYTIEHEVRGLHHAMYRRPLVNRNIGEYLEPIRVGNTTVFGSQM